MGNKSPVRNDVLRALCEHPLLTRRQLELYLGFSERTVRHGLRELQTRKWVWRTNARQPRLRARCLYAPTSAGIETMVKKLDSPSAGNALRAGLTPARLDRLILTMERTFQLQTIFLWLMSTHKTESYRWRAVQWDVEVTKFFSAKGRGVWIPFHGAAILQRGSRWNSQQGVQIEHTESQDARWVFVVVEFDLSRVAVERDPERLHQFVASQDDPRYWGKEKESFFPILLVIAQDELRLQDYYNVLRTAALSRQLPMPRAYLTTIRAALSLRNDNTAPIWHSTISGRRTALLFDTEGVAGPRPEQTLWRKLPLTQASAETLNANNSGTITPELTQAGDASTVNTPTLAKISMILQPLEKRLLDEIAAHPLLSRSALIVLLKASLRRVQPGLAKLISLKLVERHGDKYLIALKGQQYLAVTAGFGGAVQRYARARGWGKGFDVLMRHAEHTEQENKFFLHLAHIALSRKHRLIWLSELESRLYYEAGNRRHSFLPDGRGTYSAGKTLYEFAVEIDRSRSPQERIRLKLAEYEACISSNVLRSEGIELLRLLVLTSSWERADTWWRSAQTVQAHFRIYITTFDRVYASGADAPIWLRGDEPISESAAARPKVHCFECFAKTPRPKPSRTLGA
jgi:hypothetical protein